ncbi:18392_t:CDS:2 [Entrophospora sp. SA101]|nr:8593_t:CDS:2 [Entrophospora candida]CAJ0877005.1 7486_t:CDS:2 [Entrophospora sp. SA101]CAJ0899061.1 18392_t:CDS:2 [Entrophospora sp. SA101]
MSSTTTVQENPVDDVQTPQELVENVVQQMQSNFDELSASLFSKMDNMGSRIDTLEKSLGELMEQMNK